LVIAYYGLGFAVLSLVVFQGLPKNVSVAARGMTFIIGESIVFVFFAVVFGFSVVLGMVSRKNKTLLTERNMTFDDHGFTSETQYSRSEMKWPIVQKLARTRNYIFIYVAQHSAHIVPRRAFGGDTEWDSFYEFCKQRSRAT